MAQRLKKKEIIALSALVTVWLAAIIFGQKWINEYQAKPASALAAPHAIVITPDFNNSKWSLIMAVHPKCPCTRATINELNRLAAKCNQPFGAVLFFYRPSGSEPNWNKTDLWKSAAEIPGITCVDDPGGKKAIKFNATTSGETFLYSPTGKLSFHGGITEARGHEGDNVGEDAIVAMINGEQLTQSSTPIFGCSIR